MNLYSITPASITYQDSNLPSLRLIQLVPHLADPLNERLQCEINVLTIEDDPDYQAISYVLGTLENRSSIQVCNGHFNSELEILANLGAPLCRFQNASSIRTLGIDSTCTNQNEDDECSQQVQWMGKQCWRAFIVLIWLGEDSEEGKTTQACICMSILGGANSMMNTLRDDRLKGLPESTTEADSFLGITGRSSGDSHTEIGIPLLGSPSTEGIQKLGTGSG